ncbi:hypothetical protein Belba_0390 [Belliella baltica DSM 15883]|uniref:Uncharacterized protein n=1 Tax=Belliella baltica (strain DSM 15883 / CIP 108006 / LMG 21964 / BA134) TaxID=866536 RepID=I3Z1D3_BELBD|nr:hypothetical protein [Belliella baltica]AFL83051.1 hypothetical protein Belba_0390 [Belliella baltica DSM 15883]
MIVTNFDFDTQQSRARRIASEMIKNGLYSRFGLNSIKRLDKAYLGCLGELAFAHWLEEKKIAYKIDNKGFENRNSDEYDFLINGKKIDIKVALKSTLNPPNDNWTYGYPQEQNPLSKDFVIIGWIDFTRSEVGFYGWLTGLQISKSPIVTKNSFRGYHYKTPNHEFKWGLMNKDFEKLIDNLF